MSSRLVVAVQLLVSFRAVSMMVVVVHSAGLQAGVLRNKLEWLTLVGSKQVGSRGKMLLGFSSIGLFLSGGCLESAPG